MNLKFTPFWRIILFSYIVACYFSRIPGYFIDWQKGLPPEGSAPGVIEGTFSFILAPIIAPIALVVETFLAFAWGPVMLERLLPLLTFITTLMISWFILNRFFVEKQINTEN